MPFEGERTLGLVNYLCNIISKVVAEDRGLPFLLVTYMNLYAVSSLKNIIYRFASNGSTGKKIIWKVREFY